MTLPCGNPGVTEEETQVTQEGRVRAGAGGTSQGRTSAERRWLPGFTAAASGRSLVLPRTDPHL